MRIRLTNYLPWCAALALALTACGSREPEPTSAPPPAPAEPAAGAAPVADVPSPAPAGTWTGDLDGMTERRVVRMLVIYSKTSYFLDNAQQRGATYDMGVELEKWLNREQQGPGTADPRGIHSNEPRTAAVGSPAGARRHRGCGAGDHARTPGRS